MYVGQENLEYLGNTCELTCFLTYAGFKLLSSARIANFTIMIEIMGVFFVVVGQKYRCNYKNNSNCVKCSWVFLKEIFFFSQHRVCFPFPLNQLCVGPQSKIFT